MRSFAFVVPLVVLLGCAAASERQCSVGADCASGACTVDGRCVPKSTPDGGEQETSVDAPPTDADADDVSDGAPVDAPGCTPNDDGKIEALEVPLQAGLKATFRVAENASVSTAGTPRADGTRKWDLSGALAGDRDVLVQTKAVEPEWFGPKFPGASYATPLSSKSDLLGVFRIDAAALVLLGAVSPKESSTKTELRYATPPQILAFPLEVGKTFKTTSNVNGTANGFPTAYSETYDAKVDARGEMVTPFGSFRVLRVRMVLTRTVGVSVTTIRTYAFVAECFGTVATIVSRANELQEEFSTADEVRRLAP